MSVFVGLCVRLCVCFRPSCVGSVAQNARFKILPDKPTCAAPLCQNLQPLNSPYPRPITSHTHIHTYSINGKLVEHNLPYGFPSFSYVTRILSNHMTERVYNISEVQHLMCKPCMLSRCPLQLTSCFSPIMPFYRS